MAAEILLSQNKQIDDQNMNSGDIDRVALDDQVPSESQTCENEKHKSQAHLIAKEYEDLETQKAEFKKLQEDHQNQVVELEEAKIEFEDKVMGHKMQLH